MDNSEIHYVTYDPEEIWNGMIENYVEEGGDILYPGDEKEMLLRSVQQDIIQAFAGVDNALRMQTLRYAVGEYLDVYGEMRSCYRIEATQARATVTITTNATGKTDTIPAGTAMTQDGQIYYLLEDDLPISGYETTVTVGVIAEEAGVFGNGLKTGSELQLSPTNPNVNRIVAASDASGGNDKEEDEAYRERIREFGLASVTTGPYQQYESAAEKASSAVIDAKAKEMSAGNVGIYLIVQDGVEFDPVKNAVLEELSSKDKRPLTDHVFAYKATDVSYTLNVNYSSNGSSYTQNEIANVVKEYQEQQDNEIGLAFNPDKLMALMYQAGAERVIWGEGSVFNGSDTITYTTIQDTERCKGKITLKSI